METTRALLVVVSALLGEFLLSIWLVARYIARGSGFKMKITFAPPSIYFELTTAQSIAQTKEGEPEDQGSGLETPDTSI